jgi:hypothetical protein
MLDRKWINIELQRKHWPEKLLLDLTKLGDPLFDYLSGGLVEHRWNTRVTANALFLLGNLVRQACHGRKQELLDLALPLLDDDRKEVRDAATRVVVTLLRLAERISKAGIRRSDVSIERRLARALAAGVSPETLAYAEHFLQHK